MKALFAVANVLLFSLPIAADDPVFDVEQFGAAYLSARTTTQQPNATCEEML
jgi:hypothetical protein